jgi:hypothetical protein
MTKQFTSAATVALVILVVGTAAARWISGNRELQTSETNEPRVRREIALAQESDVSLSERENRGSQLTDHVVQKGAEVTTTLTNEFALSHLRPRITTNTTGKKSYFFSVLYGTNNQIVARDAQFRELLGYTKLAFRTSEGPRYYDIDDLHPEVTRSLGYDAMALKRALAEQFRQQQLRAAQAQFQADLRTKYATELAAREQAAAERTKAEAALREAEAKERIAAAVERAATNPPRERIVQRYLVVPSHSTIITNAPLIPPLTVPSSPSIQPIIE